MKNTKKHSFLIITTSFAPENAIGSIRLTKIAKYLVRNGHRVTVLSPKTTLDTKIDETLNTMDICAIRKIEVSQSSIFNKLFFSKRKKLLKKESAASLISAPYKKGITSALKVHFYIFLHFIYTLIRNIDWKNSALKQLNIEEPNKKFDFIISSYPSLGAMWVAKSLRSNNISPVWLADFRDPINYHSSNKLVYFIYKLIQKNIVRNADCVSLISKDLDIKFPKEYKDKYHVIYNGFDSDDIEFESINVANIKQKDFLIFCYVGSLYGKKRNIEIFFKSLKILIKNNAIDCKKLIFNYAGNDFQILKDQASLYGLDSILKNHGYINRKASIQIQQQSDITIVATWNTIYDQGILTGKLLECFLTKSIILGVVNGNKANSEFKRIVKMVNGGYVYEEATPFLENEFHEYIKKKYDEKLVYGLVKNTYNKRVDMFSYENIVSDIEQLLTQAQEKKGIL